MNIENILKIRSKTLMFFTQRIILVFSLLLSASFAVNAQNISQVKNIGTPFIRNYSPEEYSSADQNWEIRQSSDGIIYFANSLGLLEFDGNSWRSIDLANSPTIRSFCFGDSGEIYIGAQNDFGILSPTENGAFSFRSLVDLVPEKDKNFTDIWNVHKIGTQIFFRSASQLFIYQDDSIKILYPESSFARSFEINNELFLVDNAKGILKLVGNKLDSVPSKGLFYKNSINLILPYNNQKKMIVTRSKGIFIHDNETFTHLKTEIDDVLTSSFVYCGVSIYNEYFAFGVINKGILIIDKKGNLVQVINKKNGLQTEVIYHLFVDKHKNLWAALGQGISHIEINSPFTYLNANDGYEAKSYSAIFHNDALYIGGNPLVYYRKWSDFKSSLNPVPFIALDETLGQTWRLYNVGNEILAAHSPNILKIDETDVNFVRANGRTVWNINKVKNNPNQIIIGENEGLHIMERSKSNLTMKKKVSGFDELARFVVIDSLQQFWIQTHTSKFYRLTLNDNGDSVISKHEYDLGDERPLSTGSKISIVDNNVIVSASDGFYVYDSKLDSFVLFETFNKHIAAGKPVNISYVEPNGNVWFNDEDGMGYFKKTKENSYEPVRKPFLKFNKIAESYNQYTINDSNVLILRPKFFIHYNPFFEKNYETNFNAYVRKIQLLNTDSVIFWGKFSPKHKKAVLKNDYNSIRIEFASAFFENIEKTKYKFKLDNYDKDWSSWTSATSKEYTKLPYGNYTFRVKAVNVFKTESSEATFSFTVLPAWYQTIWAYFAYFLLALALMWLIVKLYTKRLKAANIKLEKIVKERTSEIREKNEELMQQKEEILTIAEELSATNEELEKLSIVASETDNAVLIIDSKCNFMWMNVAATKMLGYSPDEFFKKSPNLITISTNPQIKQIVDKCLTTKQSVSYQSENETKDGRLIYVQTTLTPIVDEKNEIVKLVAIDSDITKLKEAEQIIKIKNEQITASIRYAQTIQKTILPLPKQISEHFDNFVIYKPKDIVSGDFYWYLNVKNTNTKHTSADDYVSDYHYIAVVDCTGHGVPGAFMSLIGSRLLNEIVIDKKLKDTAAIMEMLDNMIVDSLQQKESENRDGMDLSIIRIEKNNDKTILQFTGARNNAYIIKAHNNELVTIKADRRHVGGVQNRRSNIEFTNQIVEMNENDKIYLLSDGIIDQNNIERKKFTTQRFLDIITANSDKNMETQKQIIESELNMWMQGTEQRDDITLMGIKF